LIGAVNTVVNRNGKLVGYNTDAYGFIHALEKDANFSPKEKKVLILGAGGAARAVCISLIQKGIDSLVIANRTLARSITLQEYLMKLGDENKYRTRITTIPWQRSELQQMVTNCHLIVNCTIIGMKHSDKEGQSPLPQIMIPQSALVYDLVYNPLETPLLRSAKEAGASIMSGLPMLVYQGAAAFKLWIGKEAPVDIMFSAVKMSVEKLLMGEE
jgi:shikimate dehydrogenase